MAADLAATPTPGLRAQLCGDAHLSNFGGFASPERELVFDVNDFDETAPGPFEWDVKRLAASIEIAARERGFDSRQRQAAVIATVGEYRGAMQQFAGMGDLDVWYAKQDIETLTRAVQSEGHKGKQLQKAAEKAHTKDSTKALSRLTQQVNGTLRIVSDPPLIVPLQDLIDAGETPEIEREISKLIDAYKRTLSGAAARLHGSVPLRRHGSQGRRRRQRRHALLDRPDARAGPQRPAVSADQGGDRFGARTVRGKSRFSNHGRRVIEGQWLMQSATDIMLGWVRVKPLDGPQRDFYVRQLWDWRRPPTSTPSSTASSCATGRPAGGRSRSVTPARATRSRSRDTSGAATRST